MHFILCKSSKLYSIMEVKVWLIDRISEEELWLVEIKFGGIFSMVIATVYVSKNALHIQINAI